MKANRGYTLLEILVAVAIAATLAALALRSLVSARGAVATGVARASLQESLWEAMRVSALERQHVVLCASEDGKRCSSTPIWEQGWIAFIDRNRDRQPDPGARLLRHQESLGAGLTLRSTTGRTRIVLQPNGGAAAGSNVTFTFCDSRGSTQATAFAVANSGRLRSVEPRDRSSIICPG